MSKFSSFSEESDDFFDGPEMVREPSLHRWRHAKGLMYPTEVVVLKYTAGLAARSLSFFEASEHRRDFFVLG